VTENGKPAVDFDGVNDLFVTTRLLTDNEWAIFNVSKIDAFPTSIFTICAQHTGATVTNRTVPIQVSNPNSQQTFFNNGTTYSGTHSEVANLNQTLRASLAFDDDYYLSINGDLEQVISNKSLTPLNTDFTIGALGNGVNIFNGNMQELITYSSNQSTNRVAIETNINTFYVVYPDFSVSGLLHDYPNAAAAYSVRQLTIYNNGYKEKLIRIRRSSGGETDVFADDSYELSLNSRVSAGGTLGNWMGSDDGFVVTWYDQSTNGNDATQGTAANQPKIVSGGSLATLGSEVTPVRQGVTTSLDISGIESSVTGAFTIATRFYLSSQSDLDCIFGGRGLTAGAGLCASYLSGAWRFEVITTIGTRAIVSVSDTNTPINNWHNVIFTWDGTTNSNAIKVYLNTSSNVFSATANGTVINYDASYPMSIFNADRNSFDGGLATWDIWNSQITDIDGLFTALDETAFDLT
jgi:hypothetical protein